MFQRMFKGALVPSTLTMSDPPVFVWQSAMVSIVVITFRTVICCVVVDGALPGPLTVNVTVYVPGAENVCDGFAIVAVLFVPEAGSPKFQLKPVGHSVDVLVKLTVLLFTQL